MCRSCQIQGVEIVIEFWIFIFFWFSAEKNCNWILHHGAPSSYKLSFNSKKIQLQSSIKVICTSFRSDFFFSWKLKTLTTISIFNSNFNTLNMTWSTHNFLWFSYKNLKFIIFDKIDSIYKDKENWVKIELSVVEGNREKQKLTKRGEKVTINNLPKGDSPEKDNRK